MIIKIEKIDVFFDTSFNTPQPNIIGTGDIISSLINSISPRFPILSENVKVYPSNVLSEIKILITLFNNNALLEFTADRFKASFKNAIGNADIEIMKDCINLAMDGLNKALPNISYGGSNFLIHMLAKPKDECKLEPLIDAKIMHDKLQMPEDEVLSFGHKIDINSKADGWRFSFSIEPQWGTENNFFISSNITFTAISKYQDIGTQAELIASKLNNSFSIVNIEVAKDEV